MATESQTPLMQSPAPRHFCCGPLSLHVAPQEPPQSTSVSSASITPSEQCAATQLPVPLQTLPLFEVHAVPSGRSAVPHTWDWQVAFLQSLAGLGHSAGALHPLAASGAASTGGPLSMPFCGESIVASPADWGIGSLDPHAASKEARHGDCDDYVERRMERLSFHIVNGCSRWRKVARSPP